MSVFARPAKHAKHAKPSATGIAARAGLTTALLPMALALPATSGTATAAPGVTSAVGLVGPTTTVRPGMHAFRVHVVQNGRSLANAPVRFDLQTSRGWRNAGVVRTNASGTAIGALPLSATTRIRAVALTRAVSRPIVVSVARPAASRARAAARTAPAAGDFRAAALRVALAQVGKPYKWGATGPSSFDCSGLVNFAFRSVGRSVPRTSSQLRAWATPVSRAAARPGDLVFSPGHVGIYVRPGVMIDAPNSGGRVSVRSIYARNYTLGRVG